MNERFSSQWAGELHGFLSFKRRLGCSYHRAGFTLRALDRFLVSRRAGRNHLQFDAAVLRWLAGRPDRKPISAADELCVVRELYKYLRRTGRRTAPDPLWPRVSWSSDFVPYVLSLEQVRALIRLTGTLRGAFRRTTYRTLLRVLYCTGLRFGEALRLRLRDVDLSRATFFIAATKGRSRWVPFHRSLRSHLHRYLAARKTFGPAGPDDRLFVGANRTRLPPSTAGGTICGLLRRAGFKPPSGRSGPRPYDLRHAFAVHRLTRWYRAGVDLQGRLPWLSAYMGHDDLLGTEVYLNATPELLELAANRFRRCFTSSRQR